MPTPLGFSPSFGFGDRLGLATPGHIAACAGLCTTVCPVQAAKWDSPWGADADKLRTLGLQSQFEAPEEPTNALTMDISMSRNAITQEIIMQSCLEHKAIDKSQRKGSNS